MFLCPYTLSMLLYARCLLYVPLVHYVELALNMVKGRRLLLLSNYDAWSFTFLNYPVWRVFF